MVQHFVRCMSCTRLLEVTGEVATPVLVDGQRRWLYDGQPTDKLKPQPAPKKPGGKPNGGPET